MKLNNNKMPRKLKSLLIKINSEFSSNSGFTLIELMIVIAILAGLATMFMTTFPSAQKRGRDTKRRSDLKQYQTAMELYANKNGGYLVSGGTINPSGTFCSDAAKLGLKSCPDDPKSTQHYSVNSTATQYVLWTQLEQPSGATAEYFVVCSTGKAIDATTPPTSSTCP